MRARLPTPTKEQQYLHRQAIDVERQTNAHGRHSRPVQTPRQRNVGQGNRQRHEQRQRQRGLGEQGSIHAGLTLVVTER